MDEKTYVNLLVREVKHYAEGRAVCVKRGNETPHLAALLLQKYGLGIIQATHVFFDTPRVTDPIWEALDEETVKIDPDWEKHNRERWAGRPSDVTTSSP